MIVVLVMPLLTTYGRQERELLCCLFQYLTAYQSNGRSLNLNNVSFIISHRQAVYKLVQLSVNYHIQSVLAES